MLCRVAAVKRLPVHHHSAFWSIWITEFIFSYLKIEFRLSRCLGAWSVLHTSLLVMNRLNKTEFAIFIFFHVVLASKRSHSSKLIEVLFTPRQTQLEMPLIQEKKKNPER